MIICHEIKKIFFIVRNKCLRCVLNILFVQKKICILEFEVREICPNTVHIQKRILYKLYCFIHFVSDFFF